MLKNHPAVADYFKVLSHQLYTETEFERIEVEMLDHLECLVEDYQGYAKSYDEAVQKALLAMGNPKDIGLGFNNPQAIAKYTRQRHVYSALSAGALILAMTAFIGFNPVNVVVPLIELLRTPIGFLEILKLFSTSDGLGDLMFNFFIYFYIGTAVSMYHKRQYRNSQSLQMNLTPVMVLWQVKTIFRWEYVLLGVLLMPMPLTLFGSALAMETDWQSITRVALQGGIGIMAFIISLILFRTADQYRVPKYVVLQEGFLIKDRFVTWTAIDKVRWRQDYSGDVKYYKLHLMTQDNLDIAPAILVPVKQRKYLEILLKEKLRGCL